MFRAGQFLLDINGDHQWTCDQSIGPCEGTNGNDITYSLLPSSFGPPLPTDIPVVGDWDHTGVQRSGVFRNGQWYLDINNDHRWSADKDIVFTFGQAGDIPIVGDWDNTGVQRIGVFRNGQWFVNLNNDHSTKTEIDFGQAGDIPVIGDWDNTGLQRLGVFRAGQWFVDINNDHKWTPDKDQWYFFGQPGDIPVVGDWTHTAGLQRIGVFRNGVWFLDINNDHQFSFNHDLTFAYGDAGDQPVVFGPTSWVGTWGASISYVESAAVAFPVLDPTMKLDAVTVRQVVHLAPTTATSIRLKFSNALAAKGTNVVFDAVHVAAWAGGNKIVAATDQPVTFNRGSAGVTLVSGSEVYSDPIVIPLGIPTDLAVSIHVASGGTKGFSLHPLANSTVYLAPGVDQTSTCTDQDSDAAKCSTYRPACVAGSDACTRPFLSGVELYAPGTGSNAVVTLGDSITDGLGSTENANRRWPDVLAQTLAIAGSNTRVVNSGIGGVCLLVECPGGPAARERFQRDVLSVPGVKYLVILIGVNDIVFANAATVDLIAGYQDLIARAHAEGITVYAGTITPFGGLYAYDPDQPAHEEVRLDVNQFIRGASCRSTQQCFDGYIDFDRAIADPSNPSYMLYQYTWKFADPARGDRLHPNDTGYHAMATAIDLGLFNFVPAKPLAPLPH